ncbi:ABC transporter substrate-binding protein [Vogesella sp. LIG4]|uniref:ABC transporter substrate-binding protein n=1 Tax=Vogesella sp. LIG4 TaxID=1192162 RepID=UPI00081FD522|nr:ABC transporter substrate-binding protein [Vogesella sp. LIG4]SCK19863.1 amino acid/amide ABC transporter substrate-binding protein, HAAT family [Vogesella sp. LIG4]
MPRLACLALLLCSALAAAAPPIRIGVSGPFSGGSSPMGLSMRGGIRLAAEDINRSGGVLGRQIQLVERDDRGRPDYAIRVAGELIDKQQVVATVGFANSGVALASQYRYQQASIPAITAVATAHVVTQQFLPPRYAANYVFRVAASDALQAPLIVREALRRGFRRVAVLNDSSNYGQLGQQDLLKALAASGIQPVSVQQFHNGELDMSGALREARTAGAQCILTYTIGPELAQIANTLAQMEWRIPLIGSWTLSMSNFIDNAGPNAEGARMVQTFIEDGNTPLRADFIRRYLQRNPGERIPSPPSAAQGYDSLLLLAAAMQQAGSTDGPRVRAALEDLRQPVAGLITTYRHPFSTSDHEAIKLDIPVIGEVRQRKVVYAYPQDRQRHP